jgi:predicted MPP superfamily phosphohydrolase
MVNRRKFLRRTAVSVGAGVMPTAARAARRDRLAVEHHTFTLPDLHPAHDGLRIAQLSDIHVGRRTPLAWIRQAIETVNAHKPDLVVLTGDYLCHSKRGVGQMREQLGGLLAPTVAVLGNHDHWVDPAGATRALEHHNYAVLENENTALTLRGEPFTVIGIGDLWTGNADPVKAMAGAGNGSRLYLAHGPRTADILRLLDRPMLCLSGHTHGGQVHLPGITPLILRTVAREPYHRGRFRLGKVQLYVNRGVGNSGIGIRVNADPEVSLLTLRSPHNRSA